MRREGGDPRAINAAHERRMRSPRAKSPHSKELRDKPARDGDLRPKDLGRERDPREKERRNRDPRERERERRNRDPREKERRERDPREKERRERDPRERERRERDPREKDRRDKDVREKERRERDPGEKERRDRDLRERDPRERERRERDRRDRALHERDLFDKLPREKSSRESPAQKERHRIPNTEPVRSRKNEQMRSPGPSVVKRVSGKMREETPSTCRTTSSTLSNLYAAINATEEVKTQVPPPPPKRSPPRKKEKPTAFEDSAFSIFSLAGSDPSDPEPKRINARVAKKKEARRPGKGRTQESMEKKEHLDFSASSSSVKSFEVSAITQKYLNPKPAKAAMQKTTLKPMIEEDSENEESTRGPSRRKAAPVSERRRDAAKPSQRQHDKQVRGESHKKMPPFRRGNPGDASFRRSSELLRDALSDGRKPPAQNSGGTSSRTSSISDDDFDEFKATQFSLSSDNCFNADDECFSNDEDEALAKRIAAANREKHDQAAKLRAKKAAIAGIDPASLEAKEKAPTTANYKLTEKDQEIMRQISELEAIILQHQKELPDLLDMYSEASKRAEKAQKELQKAKARVARYEKAHATVARAIRSGQLYMKQKEYMAAILELSRATGIERSNATLWYMLAECRLKVGQPAAAEEACMTSLKQQPTGAGVALLGRILHERGRHDEAIECYLSALGRNDESEDEGDSE
ncbi:hypothetical protein ON010_g17373 [Phytophthora cinnamomi]|nr:hypothetical protein ON010_g17373 [Phytophthora cinnamomi]